MSNTKASILASSAILTASYLTYKTVVPFYSRLRPMSSIPSLSRMSRTKSHHDYDPSTLIYSTTSSLSSPRLRNIGVVSMSLTYLCRVLGFLPTKLRTGKRGLFATTTFFYLSTWLLYYRFSVIETPTISYIRTFYNVQLCHRASLHRKFLPFPLLTSTHSQTVLCTVLADTMWLMLKPLTWVTTRFTSFDENKFDLDWFQPSPPSHDSPILLLLYGVGGTKNDHYIKRITLEASRRGFRVVVFSYWRLDWMETRDLKAATEEIQSLYPRASISCVACSAGAHVLIPFLHSVGESSPFICACTISGCLDFEKVYEDVSANQNASYRLMLNRAMLRCVGRHHENDVHSRLTEAELKSLKSIKRANVMYDRHLSSLRGFVGAQNPGEYGSNAYDYKLDLPEWLRPASDAAGCRYPTPSNEAHFSTPARLMVGGVKTTMLMVHSRDDTMVSFDEAVDWDAVRKNQHIISVQTCRGGHIGFHEWMGFLTGLSWAEAMVLDFVGAVLETNAQTGFLLDVMERAKKKKGENIAALRPEELGGFCARSQIISTGLDRDDSIDRPLSPKSGSDGRDYGRGRSGSLGGGDGIFF